LLSLVDTASYTPALPSGHPFTNVQNSNYWTSSTYVADPDFAWLVYMNVGYTSSINKSSTAFVWPVRGGH
jgi:hypothetical protein